MVESEETEPEDSPAAPTWVEGDPWEIGPGDTCTDVSSDESGVLWASFVSEGYPGEAWRCRVGEIGREGGWWCEQLVTFFANKVKSCTISTVLPQARVPGDACCDTVSSQWRKRAVEECLAARESLRLACETLSTHPKPNQKVKVKGYGRVSVTVSESTALDILLSLRPVLLCDKSRLCVSTSVRVYGVRGGSSLSAGQWCSNVLLFESTLQLHHALCGMCHRVSNSMYVVACVTSVVRESVSGLNEGARVVVFGEGDSHGTVRVGFRSGTVCSVPGALISIRPARLTVSARHAKLSFSIIRIREGLVLTSLHEHAIVDLGTNPLPLDYAGWQ